MPQRKKARVSLPVKIALPLHVKIVRGNPALVGRSIFIPDATTATTWGDVAVKLVANFGTKYAYHRFRFLRGDFGPSTFTPFIKTEELDKVSYGHWGEAVFACGDCWTVPLEVHYEGADSPSSFFSARFTCRKMPGDIEDFVDGNQTVGEVKSQLWIKDLREAWLIFGGERVADDRTLIECGIQRTGGAAYYPTIEYTYIMRGGGSGKPPHLRAKGMTKGRPFVDVSRDDAVVTRRWPRKFIPWRAVNGPGLCIEGVCENEECEAHGEMVVCDLGMTNFDLLADHSDDVVCPLCEVAFEPVKPGFNNCWYKITGDKISGRGKLSNFNTGYMRVGNKYETYEEDEADTVNWRKLQIFVWPTTEDGQPPAPRL